MSRQTIVRKPRVNPQIEEALNLARKEMKEITTQAITKSICNLKADFEAMKKDNNQFKHDCEKMVGKLTKSLNSAGDILGVMNTKIKEEVVNAYQVKIRPTNGAIGKLKQQVLENKIAGEERMSILDEKIDTAIASISIGDIALLKEIERLKSNFYFWTILFGGALLTMCLFR